MLSFAIRLKKYRLKANLTKTKLAELSGVSLASISRYENGQRYPQAQHLKQIANVLQVEVEELIGEGSQLILDISKLTDVQVAAIWRLYCSFNKIE